ncbi:DUF1254 domain-containing protein [Bartonella tamiae]|uniref:DUF1254 domain-containing protein n=1 Tax=Bartonella tamiae Th239 TaxID=1094558 RepID=J1K0L9_9HYPH|nr:hypothetical protein [Bartonella tamiae]EJF90575.1 hypothetical protein ME5_00976 [Bartonella tamiae Th239]EJF94047.1 hypothetical protein MEG_00905 [Bartonella tamiae Th307]
MNRIMYISLVSFIGAVIVHICVLLLIPYVTPNKAWQRLIENAPPYRFVELDKQNPIRLTNDPLFHVASCHFDLNKNPVHIQSQVKTPFWSLSIYNESGNNLYSMNDAASANGLLDLVIATSTQLLEIKQTAQDELSNSIFVHQNIQKGFVLLRSFDPDIDPSIKAFFAQTSCKSIVY